MGLKRGDYLLLSRGIFTNSTLPDKVPSKACEKGGVQKEMSEFEHKVVLVTGGIKGISKAVSFAFGMEGADVVVNFKNDQASANRMSAEFQEIGKKPMLIQADMANYMKVESLMNKIIRTFGKLDILVNNAAAHSPWTEVVDLPTEDWRKVIELNLTGVFYATKLALRSMVQEKSGCIINISSSMTRCVMRGSAPYSCSKAALDALTRVVAKEVARHGIRVNAVAPGLVSSETAERILADPMKSRFIKSIPLGRLGYPEEIAEVVKFLASDRSKYITGETITVEGGRDRLNLIELADEGVEYG